MVSYCKYDSYCCPLVFPFLIMLCCFPVWLYKIAYDASLYLANMSSCWDAISFNGTTLMLNDSIQLHDMFCSDFVESKWVRSSEHSILLLFLVLSFHEPLWNRVKDIERFFKKALSMLLKWHGTFNGGETLPLSRPSETIQQHVSTKEFVDVFRSVDSKKAEREMAKNLHKDNLRNGASNFNNETLGAKSEEDGKLKSETGTCPSSNQASASQAGGEDNQAMHNVFIDEPMSDDGGGMGYELGSLSEPMDECFAVVGNVQSTSPSVDDDQLSTSKACFVYKDASYSTHSLRKLSAATFLIPRKGMSPGLIVHYSRYCSTVPDC